MELIQDMDKLVNLKKISIIDPGMVTHYGHHADFNKNIAKELINLGYDVSIYAGKCYNDMNSPAKNSDAVTVIPYFKMNPYSFGGARGNEERFHDKLKKSFSDDLDGMQADLILLPSAFPYQIDAINKMTSPKRCAAIIHHHYSIYGSFHSRKDWANALKAASRKKFAIMFVEDGLLRDFSSEFVTEVDFHKIPFPTNTPKLVDPSSRKTIGILGNRGLYGAKKDYTNAMVDIICSAGFNVLVQVKGAKNKVKYFKGQKVEIFDYAPNFSDVIQKCSAVLLHYSPRFYEKMGSGIFWEALSCGVPVIATRDTLAYENLLKLENGESFEYGNMEELKKLLQEIKNNHGKIGGDPMLVRIKAMHEVGSKICVKKILENCGDLYSESP